jgi:hypothetical protein
VIAVSSREGIVHIYVSQLRQACGKIKFVGFLARMESQILEQENITFP